jgi:hypothetical protein
MGIISSRRVLRRAGRAGVLAAVLWPTGPLGYVWSIQLNAGGILRRRRNSPGFVKKLLREFPAFGGRAPLLHPRIDLLESSNGTFFDRGSPKLNADGQDLLIKLAEELGKLPNSI